MSSVPGTGVYMANVGSGSVHMEPLNFNLENPLTPLDDPSVYGDGMLSTSGKRVSPTTMLSLPAAFQAVERISGDVARCPLELYSEVDGKYTALKDDPLYRLTAIQPNREMDFFTFWQQVMVHRLIWRNAYIFIAPTPAGTPGELLPLLPDRTEPVRENGVLLYKTLVNGEWEYLPASRVMHIKGFTFDSLKAVELCRLMRNAFGLALSQFEFTSKVYRSGGRRGGVLEIPLGTPKTSGDKLEEGFRKKYEENGAWFTTVILRDGSKFHEAQMSLRDSQVIEGREESARDGARAFNIRPGHVGVETSGVYGNKSDDTRDYLDMTLRPHMTAIQAQARIKLLTLARQAKTVFGHNTDELLQMSVQEEFAAYGLGVEKTVITSNEARGKLGFAPHADGDKLQSPNTVSNRPAAAPPTKGKPPAKPAVDDENEEFNKLDNALGAALGTQVAAMVAVIGEKAQRAAASGAKFLAWLDGKFANERVKLERAIKPLVACRAMHRGEEPIDLAGDLFREMEAALTAIANSKSEAELLPAVTEYFKTWSVQSCPQ